MAVIGGGLLGTAICYWLARQGVSVALLERSALAAGATGRNGGFADVYLGVHPMGTRLPLKQVVGYVK